MRPALRQTCDARIYLLSPIIGLLGKMTNVVDTAMYFLTA
jgi:hypothetical protein